MDVSIIITNFNYERYLPRAIDSILGQSAPALEVIVVDDASGDGSRDVIAGYGDRIIPVLHARNHGHGAAFNSGFENARGELILFLDADDWLYPDALKTLRSQAAPGAALYQYRLDLFGADGTFINVIPQLEETFEDGDVRSHLLRRGRFSTTVTSGLAFARSALEQVMPVPEADFRQGADGYLVATTPFYGAVVTAPGILGGYHRHGANHSLFGEDAARGARWRLGHDEARWRHLRRHAELAGLAVRADQGSQDLIHLQERIMSLMLCEREHPYPGDRLLALALAAARAARRAPLSLRRRISIQALWLATGLLPIRASRRLLEWKRSPQARPKLLRALAGRLRARPSRPGVPA